MPTKTPLRTEHEEQSILMAWVVVSETMQSDLVKRSALRWTHAIPLGFHKSPAARAKGKREGVKSGVLDVNCPAPDLRDPIRSGASRYHGLYIEMKRKGERVRPTQSEFMDYLDLVHYRKALCYTWRAAARVLVEHLDLVDYHPIPPDDAVDDDREAVAEMLSRAREIDLIRNPPKVKKVGTKIRKSRPRKAQGKRPSRSK
jgi:hypothetical protein